MLLFRWKVLCGCLCTMENYTLLHFIKCFVIIHKRALVSTNLYKCIQDMIGNQMYILDCRSRSNSHKEILANLELLHLYLDLVWGLCGEGGHMRTIWMPLFLETEPIWELKQTVAISFHNSFLLPCHKIMNIFLIFTWSC